MKKGILITTILTALSFLVSVIAVAPSVALKATQTAPTTQQQTPTQLPQKQTPQFPKKMYEKKVHTEFWDLEIDQCVVIMGLSDFNPCNSTINLKKGKWTVKCLYKVKTIPINDITEEDAKFWGTGFKPYTISASLVNDDTQKSLKEEKTKMTPPFTWANVQQWKSAGQGNDPKVWTEMLYCTWITTQTQDYVGSNSFSFVVDKNNVIKEYGGELNNKCSGTITIN